jgi:hypothetical protein
MPYTVRKGQGKRPWKIVNKQSGRVAGTSTSKSQAQKSAAIRNKKG